MLQPETLRAKLAQYGQEQLLSFWNELSEEEQAKLATQIEAIDFARLAELRNKVESNTDWNSLSGKILPPRAIRLDESKNEFSLSQARSRGEEALRAGKVGVVIVAGGQGTRLGFDHPKGMFPIGPVSNRTLFQVLIDQVRARGRKYGKRIPIFVMTSPATHEETATFLNENDNFGMSTRDLTLFCQGTMPAVDLSTGKVLLAGKGEIALSPDGHGGMLSALLTHGCLDQMNERGVEYLYYCQIDNPLARVAEPELIGYHILCNSKLTTQVVQKAFPLERVGNVVSIDGRIQIIEYSDLPESVATKTASNGKTMLWAGNMAIHVFDVSFLREVLSNFNGLPFHVARKKVPFVNESGDVIQPEEPNAIKFEQFIFDLLPLAETSIAVEADKKQAFAPVKNADGSPNDTPASAKEAISALHRSWIEKAGIPLPENAAIEVSPFFALDEFELVRKKREVPAIQASTFLQ